VEAPTLDYVNAHGTATLLNDTLEALALVDVFGAHSRVMISSTKGATGHLLGATGAVELAFTLLAMRDGVAPPTLGLSNPETDLLDFVPERPKRADIRTAATLSFGFGGAIGSLVVGRVS
jgi:3-oxoacyl-[acyl-carrier-protein] synthase II